MKQKINKKVKKIETVGWAILKNNGEIKYLYVDKPTAEFINKTYNPKSTKIIRVRIIQI